MKQIILGNTDELALTQRNTIHRNFINEYSQFKKNILLFILCVLLTQQNEIKKDQLDSLLSQKLVSWIEMYQNVSSFPVDLIQLDQVLNDLIRENYLTKSVPNKSDPSSILYHWGYRAKLEFPFSLMIQYLQKVN